MKGRWSKDPTEIVRDYFPDASNDAAAWIAWNRTGFPNFFRGASAWEHEAVFRDQLKAYRCALDLGFQVCELCPRAVEEADIELSPTECRRCRDAIQRIREEWKP